MKFYFDCGLPRSGSTLLTALLNQNPNIHAGTLSPVFELMYYTNEILHNEQAKAFPKPKVFQEIVTSTIVNYYSDVKNEVVIDKCRAWPAHIDIIKKHVTNNPKLICTVRHPLDMESLLYLLEDQNQRSSLYLHIPFHHSCRRSTF